MQGAAAGAGCARRGAVATRIVVMPEIQKEIKN